MHVIKQLKNTIVFRVVETSAPHAMNKKTYSSYSVRYFIMN